NRRLEKKQPSYITNYLNDLKIRLQLAAEQAGTASTSKQTNYVFDHNLRKMYKSLEIGDKVIVLVPVSTHKMYARWTSPCTIVEKRRAHSYRVRMPDNNTHYKTL
ncbi:hypothetical protein NPIL_369441, partial [Nephila pilipes]